MSQDGAEAAGTGGGRSPAQILLDASSFAKAFGTTKALVRGDLLVRVGEIHALVGHNG